MGRVPGNAGGHISKPSLRIDIIELRRLCRQPNYAEHFPQDSL
jgi:hypothetical protein